MPGLYIDQCIVHKIEKLLMVLLVVSYLEAEVRLTLSNESCSCVSLSAIVNTDMSELKP